MKLSPYLEEFFRPRGIDPEMDAQRLRWRKVEEERQAKENYKINQLILEKFDPYKPDPAKDFHILPSGAVVYRDHCGREEYVGGGK